jgi:hypothetical protein
MVKNDSVLHSSEGDLVLAVPEGDWCAVSFVTPAGETVQLGSDSHGVVLNKLIRALDGGLTASSSGKDGFVFFVSLFEEHWSGYVKYEPNRLVVEFRSDGGKRRMSFSLTDVERSEWLVRLRALRAQLD